MHRPYCSEVLDHLGPAGASEQRITVLNNPLYDSHLYHQNRRSGGKYGNKQ